MDQAHNRRVDAPQIFSTKLDACPIQGEYILHFIVQVENTLLGKVVSTTVTCVGCVTERGHPRFGKGT